MNADEYCSILISSLAITFYIFILLRIFFPRLIGKKFSEKKFSLSTLPPEINKEEFLEKLKKSGRNEAKKIYFRAIGKTETEILFDKVTNFCKNFLKFFPAVYFFFFNYKFFILYGYVLFLSFIIVKGLKSLIKKPRPDGTNSKSFPSAHAAFSGVGFSFFVAFCRFNKEFFLYNSLHKFIILFMFIGLVLTAASRVFFKRHSFLDVSCGLILGFSLSYLLSRALINLNILNAAG